MSVFIGNEFGIDNKGYFYIDRDWFLNRRNLDSLSFARELNKTLKEVQDTNLIITNAIEIERKKDERK